MTIEKKNLNGHLAAMLTVFIWGTTFISTKVLLADFTPIEILFFRFTIGFIALMVIYPKRLKITERKRELYFAFAGLCGVTLYFLFENIALTYSMASNVGVIVAVAPFFTAVLSKRFLKAEKPGKQFYVGFAVAITGIALISFSGATVLKLNPIGDILAFLAAVIWSCYSILTKKISDFGYHTIQSTRRTFFYGLLFMIPVTFFMDFEWGFARLAQPALLFNILFLGLGASAICFVTWNFAIRRLGAIKTSVYIYMGPVITVVTSVIVLHERITLISLIGIILTLAGLFLSEWRKHERNESIS